MAHAQETPHDIIRMPAIQYDEYRGVAWILSLQCWLLPKLPFDYPGWVGIVKWKLNK